MCVLMADSAAVFAKSTISLVSACAPDLLMVVRHFSQLICWQMARELQREVFRITSKSVFNGNFDLRDQLRDAASSARRNMAEGFSRRTHKDHANFLRRLCHRSTKWK